MTSRRLVVLCLAAWGECAWAGGAGAQTLRAILAEHDLRAPATAVADLDIPLANAVVDDAADRFVAVYEPADPAGNDVGIVVFEKRTRAWRQSRIPRQQRTATDEPWILGSIISLTRSHGLLYVESHINPSASVLVVLRVVDLRTVSVLPGWIRATLPDGAVVFEHNQIHFAPTHPAAVWLFDPASRQSRALYPTTPYQPVRREYVEQVRRVYARLGEEWMRAHNHHGDPERFDSRIDDPIVVSSDGRVIAFVAHFGTAEPAEDATPPLDVVVVCGIRASAGPCSETPLTELRRGRADAPIEVVLRDALGGVGAGQGASEMVYRYGPGTDPGIVGAVSQVESQPLPADRAQRRRGLR